MRATATHGTGPPPGGWAPREKRAVRPQRTPPGSALASPWAEDRTPVPAGPGRHGARAPASFPPATPASGRKAQAEAGRRERARTPCVQGAPTARPATSLRAGGQARRRGSGRLRPEPGLPAGQPRRPGGPPPRARHGALHKEPGRGGHGPQRARPGPGCASERANPGPPSTGSRAGPGGGGPRPPRGRAYPSGEYSRLKTAPWVRVLRYTESAGWMEP